jgi:HNH endonuclease
MDTFHQRRKESGLCVGCGKVPPQAGRVRCQDCLDSAKDAQIKIREKRVKNGLCPQCGKYPPEQGKVLCIQCSEFAKKRKERRKKQGLCVRCGNPTIKGKTTCESCSDRVNKSRNVKYAERKDSGLCPLCGVREPVKGYALCKPCNDAKAIREKRYRSHWFKAQVKDRDDHKCRICGSTKYLIVHHKDGQGEVGGNPNNDLDNLITLCTSCHNHIEKLRRPYVDQTLAVELITFIKVR